MTGTSAPSNPVALELTGLSKRFAGRPAVTALSLRVLPGDTDSEKFVILLSSDTLLSCIKPTTSGPSTSTVPVQ